jgi:CO/xanthine dehydrogenase Mo-binding subunit
VGFACGFKNVGFSFGAPEHAWATVELHGGASMERAVVHHAGAECGQGAHTVMAQMAAQALGLPVERSFDVSGGPPTTPDQPRLRMTFMASNSIRSAARLALTGSTVAHHRQVQYRPPAQRRSTRKPEVGPNCPMVASGRGGGSRPEINQVRLLDVVCADVGKAVSRNRSRANRAP